MSEGQALETQLELLSATTTAGCSRGLPAAVLSTSMGGRNRLATPSPSRIGLASRYWLMYVREVLNEPDYEFHHTPVTYTAHYDAIVAGIRRHADAEKKMKFVGLALAGHREFEFYRYFLNSSNHQADIPLDYISYHFYASCSLRTDPSSYESFFAQADDFKEEVSEIEAIRTLLSPATKTTIDEIGVILPDDNTAGAPIPPRIYWNAAGSLYAYVFALLSAQGIDVLGESQLVGFPQLPHLGLDPQFPSVTMLDWDTGLGNARYDVLKMLIDSFRPGDKIFDAPLTQRHDGEFCGIALNLEALTLSCDSDVISEIVYADYGTPAGSCGASWAAGNCSTVDAKAILSAACVGKKSCTVLADTKTFGDPCFGTVKHLVVKAACARGVGSASSEDAVYARTFVDAATGARKVLLGNKRVFGASVGLSEAFSGRIRRVASSEFGRGYVEGPFDGAAVDLAPFEVAVLLE